MFGPFTTVIGLAIVAVGAVALARAQLAHEVSLLRPGIMAAASGQVVFLLGIVALALQSMRKPTLQSTFAHDPGQMADLKAQLAILVQRLDHRSGKL